MALSRHHTFASRRDTTPAVFTVDNIWLPHGHELIFISVYRHCLSVDAVWHHAGCRLLRCYVITGYIVGYGIVIVTASLLRYITGDDTAARTYAMDYVAVTRHRSHGTDYHYTPRRR